MMLTLLCSDDLSSSPAVAHRMLASPLFERVWVLQELVLSRDPWVQCGISKVRWENFCERQSQILTEPLSRGKAHLCRGMIQARQGYWHARNGGQMVNPGLKRSHRSQPTESGLAAVRLSVWRLASFVHMRRGLGVSDTRDYIYAHLGLLDSNIFSVISVDYEQSLQELYEAVARLIAQTHDYMLILELVAPARPEYRRVSIPSWVPDVSLAMLHTNQAHLSQWSQLSTISPDVHRLSHGPYPVAMNIHGVLGV
jgi:hypothetical protein